MRRRDASDASNRLASFSGGGEEVGHFCKIAGMSIVAAGGPCSAVDTINCRQPSGLNKLLILT